MGWATALADLLEAEAAPPPYRWACGVEHCDGQPHAGADQPHARAAQQPPPGGWATWLIRAGRGFGKTRTGAEVLTDRILAVPATTDGAPTEWLVAGPTIGDTREICALGPSGIVAALRRREVPHEYNRSLGIITLATGQRIHLRGGDDHDLARGLNLAGVWLDEVGTWRRALTAWAEGVVPALRQPLPGDHPRAVLTTTPKPGPGARLLADLAARTDGSVVVTRGATFDNAANLSAEALAELRARYPEGSRLHRQELLGEIVEDVEGALWDVGTIDRHRVAEVPGRLARLVVAVDPAASYGPDADDTGIVAVGTVGRGHDRHYFVLRDATCHLPPEGWAGRALDLAEELAADGVVFEVNQGGEMVRSVLVQAARDRAAAGPMPRLIPVRATRGKAIRAEPVAALYAQGRVHHVGALPELEAQLTTWTPEAPNSPDRLDALVWAVTHLAGAGGGVAGTA